MSLNMSCVLYVNRSEMQNDIMVDKPSLTSAHLVVPLIVTNNCLSSKCYNIFRPHARCREARNCTGKRKETEK